MIIHSILDKNALQLLAELRLNNQIDFEEKNINCCELFTLRGKSIIYYNPEIVDTESIAHELLHIWLKKFNYVLGNHIYLTFKSDWNLSKIFTKFLCDYIENCCDHYKMYPKFKAMGYDDEKFLINGLAEKCSITDIKKLHLKFLGKYVPDSVNKFIGYLISIYADHADNNYDKHLMLLESKEPELFKIVTKFWDKWKVFDIENIDPVYNSDIELVNSFLIDIEDWIRNKKIK